VVEELQPGQSLTFTIDADTLQPGDARFKGGSKSHPPEGTAEGRAIDADYGESSSKWSATSVAVFLLVKQTKTATEVADHFAACAGSHIACSGIARTKLSALPPARPRPCSGKIFRRRKLFAHRVLSRTDGSFRGGVWHRACFLNYVESVCESRLKKDTHSKKRAWE